MVCCKRTHTIVYSKGTILAKKDSNGNLVWLDLEMTGLDIANDVILEIACIITDGNLNIIAQGPSFIINQPEEKLSGMGKWCQDHHGKTGLIGAVRESTTTLEYAAEEILAFIKYYCPIHTGILAGNSVWQDRVFLDKYMPSIPKYLHYRIVDVSTIKELVRRWYPKNQSIDFKKSDRHRALSDVQESIEELKHYRRCFFDQKNDL